MLFHFLINVLFIVFITCEDIWIWPNIFYKRELYDDETIFFLEIYEPKDEEKMKIEFFLSHPSSYQISFNYSDYIEIEEEEEDYEEKIYKEKGNILEEEREIENGFEKEDSPEIKKNKDKLEYKLENTIDNLYKNNIFENPLRILYEYPNDLIEFEEEYSNKKTYILNLEKNMTIIQLIFKKIKSTVEFITPAVYIKYQYKKNEFKNYIFYNNLSVSLINGIVIVDFKGIIPEEESKNINEDFQVEYEAFLYKKIEEENCENINHIFLPNRFISRSGTLKIKDMKESMYSLMLTGIDQNGNDQWLEVVAEILYGYDREYFVYNITLVFIENRTIVYPDDNNTNNKTDNKTDNKTENKTNDDNEKKKNNVILFYIIISVFVSVIIVTFIIVFILLKKKSRNKDNYQNEKDENTEILNEENEIN